jgi:hypothetical protein
MTDDFDPADAGCWMARGRSAHHAAALAEAWQHLPDLPKEASLENRMARTRERVQRLRPLHEAVRLETEQERQRSNFAFAQRKVAEADNDSRYCAILHARDAHDYDWNAAVAYADGRYAAIAGRDARFLERDRGTDLDQRRSAYSHGFRDGGGQPDDIFDGARRAFAAADRLAAQSAPRVAAFPARPLPSLWPIPSDRPAPSPWHRRLIVMGRTEIEAGTIGLLALLRAAPGADAVLLAIADPGAGIHLADPAVGERGPVDLASALADHDLDDILVAAQGDDLACIDAWSHRLPITRNMERTRNSAIQQRVQLRIWLARGRAPGDQFAAGHIRWGKVAAGLTGRLGEFTARYVGPAQPRGHRITVEDTSGGLARGYHSASGQPLEPEIVITNRTRLRAAMTTQLRSFAAGLRF